MSKASNNASYTTFSSNASSFSLTETASDGVTKWKITKSTSPSEFTNYTGQLAALSTVKVTTTAWSSGVVVSPDNNYLYITGSAWQEVDMFSRDKLTGQLKALNPASVVSCPQPRTMAMSSDGASLYAACGGTISMFSRNSATGQLTALSPSTVAVTGAWAYRMAVSPDGTSVYTVNNNDSSISMYNRNTSTGMLTALSPATITVISSAAGLRGIVISPDSKNVYASYVGGGVAPMGVYMFSRDLSTGLLSALNPTYVSTAGYAPEYLAISPDGKSVYSSDNSSDDISMFSRDASTGKLMLLTPSSIGTGDKPQSLAVSPDGANVYVANYGGDSVSMFSRDTLTGKLTALSRSTIPSGDSPSDIAISPDGNSVYVGTWESGNGLYMFGRN